MEHCYVLILEQMARNLFSGNGTRLGANTDTDCKKLIFRKWNIITQIARSLFSGNGTLLGTNTETSTSGGTFQAEPLFNLLFLIVVNLL
jgi:hypothetical protein